jgi:predicted Zn-dependent protease
MAADPGIDSRSAIIQDQLEEMAMEEQRDMELRGLLIRDEILTESLANIAGKLRQETGAGIPRFQVRVLKRTAVDAFVYPNGICYLTSGLLVRLFNEDQLAMAIAHEMGHHIGRHAMQAHLHVRTTQKPGHAHALGQPDSIRADRGSSLENMRIEAELEADRQGLLLMAAAGYRPGEALDLIDRLIGLVEIAPVNAFEKRKVAKLLERRRRDLEKASAAISPRDPAELSDDRLFQRVLAQALLANAQAALSEGKWQVAEENVHRYLNAHAETPHAHYLLGEIFRHQSSEGDHNRALTSYSKAIALDAQYAPPYQAIGIIYLKSGRSDEARSYLNTYLALAPKAAERQYIEAYLKLCKPN